MDFLHWWAWIINHWDKVIPIAISLIALIVSLGALKVSCYWSRKANETATEALNESKRVNQANQINFTIVNRPLLTAMPTSFQKDNNYFEVEFLNSNTLILMIPIEIQNIGTTIADNIFLHSTNCRLYIGNKRLCDTRKEYETVTGNALTLLDLPPQKGIVKIIDFEFSLPEGTNIGQLKGDLITDGKIEPNFLFQYYSHLDKENTLALNVSFLITYKGCEILTNKS